MPYEIADSTGHRDLLLEPEFWFRAGADDAFNQNEPRSLGVPEDFAIQYNDGFDFGLWIRFYTRLETM
jgi:hypothetical protein